MTHAYLWIAIVLTGLLLNFRMLLAAARRRRLVVDAGGDPALLIIAGQAVRGEAVTLAVHVLMALLVIGTLSLPPPIPWGSQQLYAGQGWTLACCSVALTFDSLLDVRDRRRLVRELMAQDTRRREGTQPGPEQAR